MEYALIIDDSRLVRKNIRNELESLGYTVTEAEDIETARESLSELVPDVITLDMHLPDGLGLDLCREIKENPAFEKTIVMIITSDNNEEVRSKCFQAGAFGFFHKNTVKEGLGTFLKNITNFAKSSEFAGMKACVIEDSKLQRNFIIGLLRRIGLDTVGYGSIEDAMTCMREGKRRPDIFFIDYFMGKGATSADLVEEIRSTRGLESSPIIALTVADDREVRNRLFYMGVNDFFRKPFDVEEFFLRTRAHLLNKKLIDSMEEKNRLLKAQAITDGLTGLFNRRYFYEAISKEEGRFKRNGTEYAVIMFDVDHFKSINDDYGHKCGDDVLKGISELAKSSVRSADTLARYGGEEFVILLPDTGIEGAQTLAEKLRLTKENHNFRCLDRCLTSSFGVASRNEVDDYEKLVTLADDRLYQAKKEGRNRVV
ncbi:diguanylate cyclase [Limisalsivibrio acetivorans]|uniref:diguanylate cyclase n=1 Tax=Limisalsivibrio acetivorans TaxID=1304888 RepID=UPI0003B5A476|nr:diguanylate cyclase [Limisalsivibrio acetivorans]